MGKPCAVFWDIQDFDVPKGQTVNSIVDLIRSTIIKPYNLNEIFFFCVCEHECPSNVGQSLTNLDVDIIQAFNRGKDSVDIKILALMKKFVKVTGQDCTIIFLSDYADCISTLSDDDNYYRTLSDLKKLHNVSIYLIRLAKLCSPKLDQISDYTFMLNDGVLKPIKSSGSPMYFISIKNYPLIFTVNQLMDQFNALTVGSIGYSAILYSGTICIGFPTLCLAENAIKLLNGCQFHGKFLIVELIVDSPLTEILKCIKPNVTMQSERKHELKQLTFIKMSSSNETDISKIIKFCIACTAQSGSQCILSRKPFLWIVFSFESDAQDCLSKVQIMYPDAIISDPPADLNLKCLEDSYYVGSCQEMVTNGVPFSVVSPDGFDNNDWKMFFRYNSDFIGPMLYYEPTKYSLLYNLFEKLYDLGAKKVILDGNLYCAHFGSAAAHKHAFEKIHSRYLEPLEPERAPEAHKQKVTERMNRYSGIPWCFTHELGLYCLVVKIDSDFHDHFMEISKKTLGNRECIFIKSIPGAIWIGFPDKLICKNSEKTVNKFLSSIKQTSQVFVTIPSNNLLESISFRDLAGDAYDLAFLSSQLEDFKPITRPHIIERIRTQRMEQQECNETGFSITLDGTFCCRNTFPVLTFVQIVKLFIKFSKVIPLAATGWLSKLTLIYNSWHEAHTAFHYINELRTFKVPYCEQFNSACLSEQKQLDCLNISVYYIINDKRKVLEKIVQNRSLVNQTESNSSTVQSTTGIDVLDAEMIKKLQYLFVITTNSDFKFTSGMILIIKLNLVQMNCPVCIEFEDKIWVGVDDSEKGKKAKTRIDHIKFQILHEYEDDFEVGVVMESTQELPPKVNEMLANKLMNPKNSVNNVYLNSDAYPLGHFNYSYRKASGMSISRYCQLNE